MNWSQLFKHRTRTELVYQIMIDRFSDENDFRDIISDDVIIPPIYKGGNLKGVIKHLDYIKGLGVNSLLLSPFFKSDAYHGYHCTTDKNEIEHHFGTVGDVLHFINEAKRLNLLCGADFVPNHCHVNNPIVSKHTDWFRFPADNDECRYYAGIQDLPMLNLDNKGAQEYMINQALQLCAWGFDFLRIDHATGPSYSFLFELRKQIKRHYPHVRLIGEVVGEDDFKPLIPLRYNDNIRKGLSEQECRQMEYIGILDGVLDYEYYGMIRDYLREETKSHKKKSLLKSAVKKHFRNYPKNFELWLFLDNHDVDRALHLCKGDTKNLKALLDFTYQFNKSVVVLYGTEQGMMNENPLSPAIPYSDEAVRKCMDWHRIKSNVFEKLYPTKTH